jgi:hypothetical protein
MEALAEPVLAYRAPVLRPTPDVHDINNVEDPVATRVLAALRDKTPSRRGRERRSERRYPYPHPVYLTPLTSDGPQVEETVQVVGKHLSEHGLDFYHPEPLPYRRMIASLQVGGQWLGLVLDLKWCRFTADGLYDNGGRFVDTVPSPLAEP